MGVKFVNINFSIMKGDKFFIWTLLDSMIMNLGKGAFISLSEESDWFKLRLNFLFEKEAISAMFFTRPMLHHPQQSPNCEGHEPRGKPIHLG